MNVPSPFSESPEPELPLHEPVLAEAQPDPPPLLDPATVLESLPQKVALMQREVGKVVVGQTLVVDAVFQAILARGHCLLVGLPGLAKTLLVRTLSRVLQLSFRRIQFTPDLMPSDVTGTVILEEDPASNRRRFKFARGPVFTQLLLADEINRTPPKTQAALLEAMQERTVTVAGHTHALEEPFTVLATQNPIEQEGTYPLPEAQLDRFLFQVPVTYPSLEDEKRIVSQHSYDPLAGLTPVLTREEILLLREAVSHVLAAPQVVDFAVALTRATRPDDPTASPEIKRWVRWGASPRASQNLILAARAHAACSGRFHVSREDIMAIAPWVLGHRLILTFQADADGQTAEKIIAQLLQKLPG